VIWWALGGAFVAFCVAAWAFWLAIIAGLQVRDTRRVIGELLELLTQEENALKTIADAKTKELDQARAHLEYLRVKYEEARRLYEQSVVIDGPLGSKRIQ